MLKATCRYCDTKVHHHRLVTHILKEHKDAFVSEYQDTLSKALKNKERLVVLNLMKSDVSCYTCLGCHSMIRRGGMANAHQQFDNCKDEHYTLLESLVPKVDALKNILVALDALRLQVVELLGNESQTSNT